MSKKTDELLVRLLRVATGEIPHIYSGLCPDQMEGPNVRDRDCPACRVLIMADAVVSEAQKRTQRRLA